jgi:stage II sporulation protein D
MGSMARHIKRRALAAPVTAALIAAALGAAAWQPSPAASSQATVRLGPLADRPRSGGPVRLKLAEPTVRIGLTGDGRAVMLESAGGLYVVDRQTGRDVWKHIHKGPLRIVLERGGAESQPVYLVQVASLASREEADALKEKLEAETGEGVQVSRYPDRNAWRVRVGQRGSREEIAQVEERLRELGYAEIWVVQEPGPGGKQPRMRLVDEDYNDLLASSRAMLVLPAAEGRPIKVAGTAYRGAVEVLVTPGRSLQTVNVLNLEEYLKGVVPKELGPSLYPELEALKAQTVAARTYLEANRGQFSEDGYDICDTARCQVYGGMEGEHPLSDFAVEQTAGIIATWQGRPINALYTATCGGHTEDLKNVFREMEGPYLKGVTCYPDDQVLPLTRRVLRGAWGGTPVVAPSGERIDEALAILEVLGVVTPEQAAPSYMAGIPTAVEVGEWTQRALQAIGRRPSSLPSPRDPGNLPGLASWLVQALGWEERVELLVQPADMPNYLGESLDAVPEAARPALSYLVKEEILPRVRGGGEPGASVRAPITRAVVARALHRLVARYQAAGLRAAKHRGFRDQALGLQGDGEIVFYPVAPRLHLIVKSDQESVAVSSHLLQDGDNLEYHLDRNGAVDCLVIKANYRGASDDRYTIHHTWEARMPREDLETRIQARASIGRLQDLIPGRRGVSGRILDLTVVGSSGRYTFRGFDIVRLLGVRETLFLVEKQLGRDGAVENFIFTGRGWGHGVGLCQVGAYGMALRGRSYEEILRHYYTGIDLEKARAR